ncbi:hypothetical protein OJF2_52740 [Aquisphaera giovannonii]|uniref:Uncharacterized protein n=1 Tax=Aquisphaera giovannonii TaxID=406548 RepID=A0A5B9W923_9BACT|nr:hypothetical protein [Aquisphaera giovannonii]QEH36689.1 hypothetical protein OJF2_52740 [Aquisphaera giovannonii]
MNQDPNQGDRNKRRASRRDPYSRWSRLPPVFRSGEHRLPAAGEQPLRITLYLKAAILDQAEALAEKAGSASVQDYCAGLLAAAIEADRIRSQVADVEARRGALEGLNAIADDPDYLAEWREKSGSVEIPPARRGNGHESSSPAPDVTISLPAKPRLPEPDDADEGSAEDARTGDPGSPAVVRIERSRPRDEPRVAERIRPEVLNESAIDVLMRNLRTDDPSAEEFLPALRSGRQVRAEKGEEMLRALDQVEADLRGVSVLERRLSYALHRLALESQVLLTELWPGVFDEPTIQLIRAVQERVERILSGPEVHFLPPGDGPTWEAAP